MINKNFKIKKYLEGKESSETEKYIKELHDYINSFEADNIVKLIMSVDKVAGLISDDVDNILKGNVENLKLLTDDSKTFDKIQKIVEKVEHWKKVSDIAFSLKPEVLEEEEVVNKVTVVKGKNPMEQILSQIPKNK